MKKSLKNNICLILALAIIMSLFSCVFSLGAVAEETEPSKAAYLLSFNNISNNVGRVITYDRYDLKEKAVSISFKYLLKNAESNKLSVENITGDGGSFTDGITGSKFLQNGEHNFSYSTVSYDRNGVCVAVKNMSGANITAELYIWDVEIKANGNDIFKLDATQWITSTNTSYEIVTYEDVVNAKPAYLLFFNNTGKAGRCISNDIYGLQGKPVSISFKYILKSEDSNKFSVQNVVGGYFTDSTNGSRYLQNGEHSFSYSTDSYDKNGVCVAIKNITDTPVTAELYIWDVEINGTGNGTLKFDIAAEQYGNSENTSYEIITYEDAVNAKPVHMLSYAGKAVGNGSSWYAFGPNSRTNEIGKDNKAFKISFEYSLVNAENGELYIYNPAAASEISDKYSGNGLLKSGRHSFIFEADSYTGYLGFAIGVNDKTKASNAVLYIWNLKVIIDGTDMARVNPWQMSGDSIVRQPDYSEVTYGETVAAQNTYEFSFVGKTTGVTRWRTFAADQRVTNAKVKISFEYYLVGAEDGELFVFNPATAETAYNDKNTGDGLLRAGRHTFVFEDDSYSGYIGAAIAVSDKSKDCNAVIYLWNIKVTSNGRDYFSTTGYNISDENRRPDLVVKTNADIPYKGDANNDGTVDIRDLVRVKSHLASGTYINRTNVNFNGDAVVNGSDLVEVRKILLGI